MHSPSQMFLKQYRMFWEIAVEYVASFIPVKCLC